jgi:hypothetical protein
MERNENPLKYSLPAGRLRVPNGSEHHQMMDRNEVEILSHRMGFCIVVLCSSMKLGHANIERMKKQTPYQTPFQLVPDSQNAQCPK